MARAIRALHAAGVPFCTLNYDQLLERVTGLTSINFKETPKVTAWMRRESQGILHLHGSWEAPSTCILGIRDYETTLTDEVRDLIQRDLGSFSRLLFLGCGDTFADPNFSTLIKWLREKMKTAAPQHYALVSADQVAARNADPAWHGFVEPISYGADRRLFPAFLLKHFPARSKADPGKDPAPIPADIRHIDRYAPVKLIGREAETKLLNDAWAKAQNNEANRPHVLTFVALGGEGKTSLVAKWAADLAYQDWPGCDAVFAWSFYSQGTREQVAASSDLFLKEALTFFGDPAMAGSAQGAFDKGRRLAQLAGERRALLILDGLEPLQYAPSSPTPGELKDSGLAALLKGLAANNRGLCVVTTRYSIPDLQNYWQTTAPEVLLLRLSKEAGVALLRSLGVKGAESEFETLVEDVKGHALTLNLLGAWLRDAYAGDIRRRDLVNLEDADEEQGGHAFRVMEAYAQSFESEGEKGQRALAVLRLLGLFDRPADADCLEALWKAPLIPDLTEPLAGISEAQRNVATTRLQDAKLLTVNRDGSGALLALDAHPLLREYFAKALREQRPKAWRAAHQRLFEHLCATTKDEPQPTLEDLQPLYQAVSHGCQAGMQQEACYKVYNDRIQRGREAYSTRKLGASGSDLGAIACFFEQVWSRLSPALAEPAQAWLVGNAAFCLRALGRLTEALEPLRAGLAFFIKQEDWTNAAISASNLSQLELTLGEVALAAEDAAQAVTYAERSGDAGQRMTRRSAHADALHQAGRQGEAAARFREAEAMQAGDQPGNQMLHSLQGFQYCDLLFAAAESAAWHRMLQPSRIPQSSSLLESFRADSVRADRARQLAERDNQSLLDIALDHLTLGRAALYAAVLEGLPLDRLAPYREPLQYAVDGLRRAGIQEYLPRGLLTRAWLRCLDGARTGYDCAQSELDEAWEIAERGPMPLINKTSRPRVSAGQRRKQNMTEIPYVPAKIRDLAEKSVGEGRKALKSAKNSANSAAVLQHPA